MRTGIIRANVGTMNEYAAVFFGTWVDRLQHYRRRLVLAGGARAREARRLSVEGAQGHDHDKATADLDETVNVIVEPRSLERKLRVRPLGGSKINPS